MIVTYVVIGLLSVAVLVACAAAQPTGDADRARSAARRRRHVEQHPLQANAEDIRCALVRGGVDAEEARFITEKAAERGIKPFTMWLWTQQFDAQALAIVVAADLSHHDLLTHIADGTVPDLEELALFASANGLTLAGSVTPAVAPTPEPGTFAGLVAAEREQRRRDGLAA